MAEALYLKSYVITCDWDTNAKTLGASQGMDYLDAWKALMTRVQGLEPLTYIIEAKLRKAKRVGSPAFTRARSRIVAVPVNAPYLIVNGDKNKYPTLCYDVMWDPEDVLNVPIDAKILGERAIEIVNDYVSMIKHCSASLLIDDFPFDIFEDAIEEFRRDGYALRWRSKAQTVRDTPLKAEFVVKCSGEETTVALSILNRKKELFFRPINTYRGGMVDAANHHRVQPATGGLWVTNLNHKDPGHIIPLADLPEEVRAYFT